MKSVSLIIPCYNVEEYIDRCADSLVNQTLGIDNMELIFVNDASTDATYEKLCQWETNYPNSIIVINCEENGKQGTARNIGLQYASADYVGFIDSDDWAELEMYEKMYEKAKSTGADMIGVMFQREDANGKIYHEGKPYSGKVNMFCQVDQDGYSGLPGGVWSGLFRKSLIVDNEVYFPEKLAYEDNFWGALIRYYIKSYYIIDEVLYHYFVNLNSTLMQKNAAHLLDRLTIEKMKLEEFKKRGLYEKNKDRIEFQFLQLYYIGTLHMIFTKWDKVPYDVVCRMQQELCQTFPDFEKNPYLHKLNWVEEFFLKTARMNLTEDLWEEIRLGYLEDLKLVQ